MKSHNLNVFHCTREVQTRTSRGLSMSNYHAGVIRKVTRSRSAQAKLVVHGHLEHSSETKPANLCHMHPLDGRTVFGQRRESSAFHPYVPQSSSKEGCKGDKSDPNIPDIVKVSPVLAKLFPAVKCEKVEKSPTKTDENGNASNRDTTGASNRFCPPPFPPQSLFTAYPPPLPPLHMFPPCPPPPMWPMPTHPQPLYNMNNMAMPFGPTSPTPRLNLARLDRNWCPPPFPRTCPAYDLPLPFRAPAAGRCHEQHASPEVFEQSQPVGQLHLERSCPSTVSNDSDLERRSGSDSGNFTDDSNSSQDFLDKFLSRRRARRRLLNVDE